MQALSLAVTLYFLHNAADSTVALDHQLIHSNSLGQVSQEMLHTNLLRRYTVAAITKCCEILPCVFGPRLPFTVSVVGELLQEIFARQHNCQPGWVALGNQLEGSNIKDPELRSRFEAVYGEIKEKA